MDREIIREIGKIPPMVVVSFMLLLMLSSVIGYFVAVEGFFPYGDMDLMVIALGVVSLLLMFFAFLVLTAYSMVVKVKRR